MRSSRAALPLMAMLLVAACGGATQPAATTSPDRTRPPVTLDNDCERAYAAWRDWQRAAGIEPAVPGPEEATVFDACTLAELEAANDTILVPNPADPTGPFIPGWTGSARNAARSACRQEAALGSTALCAELGGGS